MINTDDFKDEDVSFPVLLRFARRTYIVAISEALRAVDCNDIPRNGMYILGSMARTETPLEDLTKQLGVSKHAASQLVDTLIARDYIERLPDQTDAKRTNAVLTERGRLAAAACHGAIEGIEQELLREVDEEFIQYTKRTLVLLIDINNKRHGLPRGPR